jgi:ASC-1-like (ASCH) protein
MSKSTHVAFLKSEHLDLILSGKKTVELRLGKNRPGAWKCEAGDTLLLKRSGGEIEARVTVMHVTRLENMSPADIRALAELVEPLAGISRVHPFWLSKMDSRYAVIITIGRAENISLPPSRTPRSIMSGWVSDFIA